MFAMDGFTVVKKASNLYSKLSYLAFIKKLYWCTLPVWMGGRVTLHLSHKGGVGAPQGGTGGVVTLSFDYWGVITKTNKNHWIFFFMFLNSKNE